MILDENLIFNSKNLEINIDEWMEGNPLWITGTSGDGKSTLSKIYKNMYKNTIIVHTDTLLIRLAKSKEKWEKKIAKTNFSSDMYIDKISLEYINTHPEMPYGLKEEGSKDWGDKSLYENHYKEYFNWLFKVAKTKYKNYRIIVEGCDIARFTDPKVMCKKPLIIIGVSRLTSSGRRIKRDMTVDNHKLIDSLFREIRRYPVYVKDLDDEKDEFRRNIEKELLFYL